MHIIILGSGVIGLSCAYYLQKSGYQITIIDQCRTLDNCSMGNAGYISPSHFMPLATPGIVAQGLKWMLDASSPFYIKPRLNGDLIKWGIQFWKHANEKNVQQNSPHLNNLLQLSRSLYLNMDAELGHIFDLQQKGCLMLYKNKKTAHHEEELVREARNKYNIDATILSQKELVELEPSLNSNVLGGAYYPSDCHLNPSKLMKGLYENLVGKGVQFRFEEEVLNMESKGGKVVKIITNKTEYVPDECIMATGSWMPLLSKKLGINLLLQAGKGISYTYKETKTTINYPAILVDNRVAITPLKNELRVAGTMEFSGINHRINMKRVKPIIDATNDYYPSLELYYPEKHEVWAGLRPVSPDGLPYIGKHSQIKNLTIAGGHAMIGISSASGTGLLVKQIIHKEKTEIPIESFRIERF